MADCSAAPSTDSIEQFIAALPKAELHLHLEGAVEPDHLRQLAARHQTDLAEDGQHSVDALYATKDFRAFIQAFKTVCQHLRTAEDYEFITYAVLGRLAAQQVRYAEIILAAGVMLWKGQDIEAMFAGVESGSRRAHQEYGIRAQWIFDAVRQFPVEQAWTVARAGAALRQRGVIGLGLGGDEAAGPAVRFREVFEFAREQGLRLHAHAGEIVGPESIWSALNELGAERIGHGLTAIQDPRLVEYLAATQIPVEICLTSNLRTGGVQQISQHPLRHMFDAGVNVSLHTDDPTLFGTDLSREYLLAHHELGFTREELRQLAANSFDSSFLSRHQKDDYLSCLAEPG